jgi:hypothetical protein
METMTSSETSLINSSEPGIFGARVTRRIFPPLAALHARKNSAFGATMFSSACAPFLIGSMNGPSMLTPAITSASGSSLIASMVPKIFSRSSFGSVMDVGQ